MDRKAGRVSEGSLTPYAILVVLKNEANNEESYAGHCYHYHIKKELEKKEKVKITWLKTKKNGKQNF